MEIGIDALPLMGRGGISRHLRELLPALVLQGSAHRYHLFARVFRRERWSHYREAVREFAGPSFYWHRIVIPDRLLEYAWTHRDLTLPGTARYLRCVDVFLATSGVVPAGAPCPIVGIVHDLVPFRFPHWFKRDLSIIQARLERLVQRSELLIAVSESTRQDLEKFLGIEPEKVRVVPHGLSARFAPPDRDRMQKILDERRIGVPYFLFVGGFGPVKNVDGLLEAFCEFRRRTGAPHHLLMAGDRCWAEGLSETIDRLGLAGAVRLLDFVGDDVLPALYAGSTALVLPSWFESFGFPALEAMACGAPVIAARVGALPDVLGDAALYFIPSAPGELSEHMTRLLCDESLRRDLQTRGRTHAAVFTWERAAMQTLAVLQEATERFKARKVHV